MALRLTAPGDAEAQAVAAAQRSGAPISLLHSLEDLRAAANLFVTVWQSPADDAPVSADLLRALSHAGNYVAGAHRGGQLVAASVGFFAAAADQRGLMLHSHISAVAPDAQGKSIGYALKLHQRAWALARGITEITWTFDPLVRRNGWFNLAKLGARAVHYHEDFYGDMAGINAGDPSDRLVVSWQLERPISEPARPAEADGAVALLRVGADGRPDPAPADANGERRLCQVPADIIALRASDPEAARAWRFAVRDAMAPSMRDGFAATRMTRDGCYVLERVP